MIRNDRASARLMRGVAHIERTIGSKTSIAEIAGIVVLSEFHFHRQFRAYFGVSVMDYVRRRRLAVAAEALLASRTSILNIALDAGFQSQSAFTRAFSKVYYTTPAQYRARGREVPWLSAVPISGEALAMLPGLGTHQPTIEAIDPFEVEGIKGSFDGSERNQIPRLWERLAHSIGFERLALSERIGVSKGDEEVTGGILSYLAAIHADADALPNTALERWKIPGGNYLVFQVIGGAQLIPAAYDFIISIWLPGSRHRFGHRPSFTRERGMTETSWPETVEIWIPVEEP